MGVGLHDHKGVNKPQAMTSQQNNRGKAGNAMCTYPRLKCVYREREKAGARDHPWDTTPRPFACLCVRMSQLIIDAFADPRL